MPNQLIISILQITAPFGPNCLVLDWQSKYVRKKAVSFDRRSKDVAIWMGVVNFVGRDTKGKRIKK